MASKKPAKKAKGPRPRDSKGRLLIEVPLWMAIVTLVFIAVLFLWAWSKGRQVTPHVRVRGVDDFAEGLASIAGMTQADVLAGNSVQVLENGDGLFPPSSPTSWPRSGPSTSRPTSGGRGRSPRRSPPSWSRRRARGSRCG